MEILACIIVICVASLVGLVIWNVCAYVQRNNGFQSWKEARFQGVLYGSNRYFDMRLKTPSEMIMGKNAECKVTEDPINGTVIVNLKATFRKDEIMDIL